MDFPKRVTLELTNFCNLNCIFCPRQFMEKQTGFMDIGLGRELIAEMGAYAKNCRSVAVVPFFRGESLTHPEWHEFLRLIKKCGLGPVQLATNASLLAEEKAIKILETGIDTLSFSMDTLDPVLYRRLRGSDYAKSLENVLRFLELRAKYGGCETVQVSAVATADNIEQMEEFVRFWIARADRVRIYPQHSADGNPGSLPANDAEQAQKQKRKPCHKVMEDMAIYWNGDAALCNHDWTRIVTGQRIGSAAEKGIQAVWQSDAYEQIRAAHLAGSLRGIAPCENCAHWGNEPVGKVYDKRNI